MGPEWRFWGLYWAIDEAAAALRRASRLAGEWPARQEALAGLLAEMQTLQQSVEEERGGDLPTARAVAGVPYP